MQALSRNGRAVLASTAASFAVFLAAAVLPRDGLAQQQPLETPNLKVMLDWTIQGTHSPFFVAEKKGYFKAEGFQNVQIDRGTGAGNTVVGVASKAYDIGFSDLAVMVRFNATNPPANRMLGTYVFFDETPIAFVSLKTRPIRTPADLDGKKLAAPANSANVVTLPILLKAGKAETAKPVWQFVAPQLMPTLLVRGDADAIGGFTNSQIPAVLELGKKMEELEVLKYADYGVDMYSLSVMALESWIQANPRTMAAFVRAFNRGVKDVIANPSEGIAVMKERDPLFNAPLETIRLNIALGHVLTSRVKQSGMSVVLPERLRRTIDTVVESENLPNRPKPEEVFTERFLPAVADRRVPALGK